MRRAWAIVTRLDWHNNRRILPVLVVGGTSLGLGVWLNGPATYRPSYIHYNLGQQIAENAYDAAMSGFLGGTFGVITAITWPVSFWIGLASAGYVTFRRLNFT